MLQHFLVCIKIICSYIELYFETTFIYRQEEMEDLRERMRVETGLIIVGSADDYLRVNKKKRRIEGVTQSIVDRCIVVSFVIKNL